MLLARYHPTAANPALATVADMEAIYNHLRSIAMRGFPDTYSVGAS
jgi:hypothetical protein